MIKQILFVEKYRDLTVYILLHVRGVSIKLSTLVTFLLVSKKGLYYFEKCCIRLYRDLLKNILHSSYVVVVVVFLYYQFVSNVEKILIKLNAKLAMRMMLSRNYAMDMLKIDLIYSKYILSISKWRARSNKDWSDL